jgi:hypothetical protein
MPEFRHAQIFSVAIFIWREDPNIDCRIIEMADENFRRRRA